jgi:hypothetical protein
MIGMLQELVLMLFIKVICSPSTLSPTLGFVELKDGMLTGKYFRPM